MSKWIEQDICPICDAVVSLPLTSGIEAKVEPNPDNAPLHLMISYRQCQVCGFVFQSPRMSDEAIAEFYSSGEYRERISENQTAMDTKELQDAERYVKALEIVPKRLMDVGCSRGYFLSLAKTEFNCTTIGVEPNTKYVTVKPDVLLSGAPYASPVDTITAWHVLEHVPDPVKFLGTLVACLAPGGRILMEVPHVTSAGGPYRLAHLSVFHPWTLQLLCNKTGLKLHKVSITPHIMVIAGRNNDV